MAAGLVVEVVVVKDSIPSLACAVAASSASGD